MLDLFDENNFHQLLNIPTGGGGGSNVLDLLFARNFPVLEFDYDKLFESILHI